MPWQAPQVAAPESTWVQIRGTPVAPSALWHVTFEQRIRGQRTFDSVAQLVDCMQQDLRDVEAGLPARGSLPPPL